MAIQTINPSLDFDTVYTVESNKNSGGFSLNWFHGALQNSSSGKGWFRNGTDGQWTEISSRHPVTISYNTSTFQIAHNQEFNGTSYKTPVFRNQKDLTSIQIEQRIPYSGNLGGTFFRQFAEGCTNLTRLDTPNLENIETVTYNFFESYAKGCNKITELSTPNTEGLSRVGGSFMQDFASGCSSLLEITPPDTSNLDGVQGSMTGFMGSFQENCTSITEIKAPDLSSLERFGSSSNFLQTYAKGCSNLVSVEIPNLQSFSMASLEFNFMYNYAYNTGSKLEEIHLPDNTNIYKDFSFSVQVHTNRVGKVNAYTENKNDWDLLTTTGQYLARSAVSSPDNVILVQPEVPEVPETPEESTSNGLITTDIIGESLAVQNHKLEVKTSETPGNSVVIQDGLYIDTPELGTMSKEDKDNYLTKTETKNTFQTKGDVQADLTDHIKTSDLGSMALENKSNYYDKDSIDTKIDNLPADKFLDSAELVDDELVFKVKDSDDVTVNVKDLIQVTAGIGLQGDGTADNPLTVNANQLTSELDLDSMAIKGTNDYYREQDQLAVHTPKAKMSVVLNSLGENIGSILQQDQLESGLFKFTNHAGGTTVRARIDTEPNKFHYLDGEQYYVASDETISDVANIFKFEPGVEVFKEITDVDGVTKTISINNVVTTFVTNMQSLLSGQQQFNQPLDKWDTSNVTNFQAMIGVGSAGGTFNQDVSGWDTSSATNMRTMFQHQGEFDQDVSGWDTSKVESMRFMFAYCSKFSSDISAWNVGKVTDFAYMLRDNRLFNSDIGAWDVSSGEDFLVMLQGCTLFDQDLSGWCVENIVDVDQRRNIFQGTAMSDIDRQPKWGEACKACPDGSKHHTSYTC